MITLVQTFLCTASVWDLSSVYEQPLQQLDVGHCSPRLFSLRPVWVQSPVPRQGQLSFQEWVRQGLAEDGLDKDDPASGSPCPSTILWLQTWPSVLQPRYPRMTRNSCCISVSSHRLRS